MHSILHEHGGWYDGAKTTWNSKIHVLKEGELMRRWCHAMCAWSQAFMRNRAIGSWRRIKVRRFDQLGINETKRKTCLKSVHVTTLSGESCVACTRASEVFKAQSPKNHSNRQSCNTLAMAEATHSNDSHASTARWHLMRRADILNTHATVYETGSLHRMER